tara:strand:- start:2876 stop:3175 length:300 start_codon:yes stop_codon:yes gene_type:complete
MKRKNTYEEAAERFAEELEIEFGGSYEVEDVLRYQTKIGMLTPNGLGKYNLKNEFEEIKCLQKDLPKKQRLSNSKIKDDLAAKHNCSPSYVFNVVRDSY